MQSPPAFKGRCVWTRPVLCPPDCLPGLSRAGPFAADPGVVVWIPFWSLHLSNLNWEQPHDFQLVRLTAAPDIYLLLM